MEDHRKGQRDDLHAVAETFLREYLAKTGSKPEPVQLASVAPRAARPVAASQAAANKFIEEHLMTQQKKAGERYEIEEPQHVVLSRRNSRGVLLYFCGFKRGAALFTFAHHLAQTINLEELPAWQGELQKRGIDATPLPAPEMHRGSL
jgi:hypothetical protein